ncbi:hypothetical protein Tco_0844733, partial [Tanacetum coccineum]
FCLWLCLVGVILAACDLLAATLSLWVCLVGWEALVDLWDGLVGWEPLLGQLVDACLCLGVCDTLAATSNNTWSTTASFVVTLLTTVATSDNPTFPS